MQYAFAYAKQNYNAGNNFTMPRMLFMSTDTDTKQDNSTATAGGVMGGIMDKMKSKIGLGNEGDNEESKGNTVE